MGCTRKQFEAVIIRALQEKSPEIEIKPVELERGNSWDHWVGDFSEIVGDSLRSRITANSLRHDSKSCWTRRLRYKGTGVIDDAMSTIWSRELGRSHLSKPPEMPGPDRGDMEQPPLFRDIYADLAHDRKMGRPTP